MAKIAGVTVTFALPETDSRIINRSTGQATDKTFKVLIFGSSDKNIPLIFHNLTTSKKNELIAALEASTSGQIVILPDSHVDLGNGAGNSINAQWVDLETSFIKADHDSWDGSLNFMYIS